MYKQLQSKWLRSDYNIYCASPSPPLFIQTPVMYRLCQMLKFYLITFGQISNSS